MHDKLPLAERPIVLRKKTTPPLSETIIADLLELLPEWRVDHSSGINRLVRSFEFPDATRAKQFSESIQAMADEANHHPLQQLEGNTLTVQWWTHSIKGLHLNDFIMAARCNEFYLGFGA